MLSEPRQPTIRPLPAQPQDGHQQRARGLQWNVLEGSRAECHLRELPERGGVQDFLRWQVFESGESGIRTLNELFLNRLCYGTVG